MCACHGPKREGIQSVVTAIPQHSPVGANSLTRVPTRGPTRVTTRVGIPAMGWVGSDTLVTTLGTNLNPQPAGHRVCGRDGAHLVSTLPHLVAASLHLAELHAPEDAVVRSGNSIKRHTGGRLRPLARCAPSQRHLRPRHAAWWLYVLPHAVGLRGGPG